MQYVDVTSHTDHYYSGSCYSFMYYQVQFAEARSWCQDLHADLVVISTEEENDFLQQRLV